MTTIGYGSKYSETAKLSVVEVAALVRKEIKAAVKSGKLPAAKYSVRSDHNSMRIEASGFAFPVLDASSYELRGSYVDVIRGMRIGPDGQLVESRRTTAEAHRVHTVLNAIASAYNFDGSDSMTDYFHVRFYLSVSVESAEGEYEAIEANLRAATAPSVARKSVPSCVAATGWDE